MDQSTMQKARSEFGLSYHVPYAALAENTIGLKGKRVLEVGGSLPERFCLDYLGASRWICIDEPTYWAEISRGDAAVAVSGATKYCDIRQAGGLDRLDSYAILKGRAEDLPETLFGQFDAIFSIAAFEHIGTLGYALDRMFQALKPGGCLFTMFSPIWSAHDGHHLPEIVDTAGRRFNFGQSPIPPWGHLTLRPPQMYAHLLNHTDPATAAEIVYYVYHSPHINRLFVEDYAAYMQASPFIVERFDLTFPMQNDQAMLAQAQQQLSQLHPGRKHFINNGILAVLRRPD